MGGAIKNKMFMDFVPDDSLHHFSEKAEIRINQ